MRNGPFKASGIESSRRRDNSRNDKVRFRTPKGLRLVTGSRLAAAEPCLASGAMELEATRGPRRSFVMELRFAAPGRRTPDFRLVRSRRLELQRPFGHSDLNAARLPVPPRPHVMK